MKQTQFLDVIDRDEAEQRWHAVIDRLPVQELSNVTSSNRKREAATIAFFLRNRFSDRVFYLTDRERSVTFDDIPNVYRFVARSQSFAK